MWSILFGTGCDEPPDATPSPQQQPVMKSYTLSGGRLNARNTDFFDADVDRVLAEPDVAGVTFMDLTGSRLSAAALSRLLAATPALKTLHIGSSTTDDDGLLAIARAPISLTTLDAPRLSVTPTGIAAFAEAARFEGTALTIGHQNIGDDGAAALARCAGLTALTLEGATLGTAGAVALLEQSSTPRISLRSTPIHLEGLTRISPTIQRISLKMTALSEADITALAAAPAPGLTELNLEQVPITDAGLATLGGAVWLSQLDALAIGAQNTSPDARRAFLDIWGDQRWISIKRRDL